MRRASTILAASLSIILASCDNSPPSARETRAADGARIAESAIGNSGENAEQANIERRLRLTSQPGLLGFIVLFNNAGQPVMYTSVKGKVTSSGKRLTSPIKEWIGHSQLGEAPSDEGTWGHSEPYIYYWTAEGQYIQWNEGYLYSNAPIRLSIKPLVIDIGEAKAEPVAPEGKK